MLVVGSEARRLSDAVRHDHARQHRGIPMNGGARVSSRQRAVAGSVILYEAGHSGCNRASGARAGRSAESRLHRYPPAPLPSYWRGGYCIESADRD